MVVLLNYSVVAGIPTGLILIAVCSLEDVVYADKFKADRRAKIPRQKQKHRVTNWSEYTEGLRRRGDLTVWVSEAALAVDSPAKIFGEGAPLGSMLHVRLLGKKWLEEKHKTKAKRKIWRKLHLGLYLVCGEIVCSDLTADHIGDPTALPGLLDQIDGPVDLFLADGTYDGVANG
tara:strand:+ start:6665 stop:7189 length:525 start_codon:yes stop_codon:yes gene_type:complete